MTGQGFEAVEAGWPRLTLAELGRIGRTGGPPATHQATAAHGAAVGSTPKRVLIVVVPLMLSGCSLLTSGPPPTPPPTPPPWVELDDVLVCEGVDRDACEEAAAAALADVAASGEGAELPTIESMTIRSDGSWEVCWASGCQGAELASGRTGSLFV